jgi:hypothetical protein
MIEVVHKYHLQIVEQQKKELSKLFHKGSAKRGR